MATVRGAFNVLFHAGLRNDFFAEDGSSFPEPKTLDEWVEREGLMPILNPDLSKIPRWRMAPKRMEHPITAWRVWKVQREGHEQRGKYILTSAAKTDVEWEGPYLRSDDRPVDPAVWDKDKEKTHHVFNYAGIHAVKTREQAVVLTGGYGAPVFGEIKLWGRVAQFELGYRAEYCMIQKLYFISQFLTQDDRRIKEIMKDLADRYQCDVEKYDRIPEW